MINALYNQYFQKSRSFLYPILGIHRSSYSHPVQTYIKWVNTNPKDRKLICLYTNTNTTDFKAFENDVLKPNRYYSCHYEGENNSVVYTFDLKKHAKDWDNFIKGKYSKLSETTKQCIREYYQIGSPECEYIDSFLYPSKYVKMYSKLLQVDKNLLIEVGELCDPPNEEKEILTSFTEKKMEISE
jgi:hypothetical protein